jgi:hypothetical protein
MGLRQHIRQSDGPGCVHMFRLEAIAPGPDGHLRDAWIMMLIGAVLGPWLQGFYSVVTAVTGRVGDMFLFGIVRGLLRTVQRCVHATYDKLLIAVTKAVVVIEQIDLFHPSPTRAF